MARKIKVFLAVVLVPLLASLLIALPAPAAPGAAPTGTPRAYVPLVSRPTPVLTPVPPYTPGPHPPQIAFQQGPKLWLTNLDGSDLRPVFISYRPPEYWSRAVMAPDGTGIALSMRGHVPYYDSIRDSIWVTFGSGSWAHPVFVSMPAPYAEPSWSPDSKFLAYTGHEGRLFVIPAAGGDPKQITNFPGAHPDWSSDGLLIVYECVDITSATNICVARPDGTGERTIGEGFGPDNSYPTWSPDGRRIALSSRAAGEWDVWVMNADGSERINLTSDSSAENRMPAWSPDGSRIAFMRSDASGPSNTLWTMRANGSEPRQVTPPMPDVFDFSWSPDGTRLAATLPYTTACQLFTFSAEGGDAHRVVPVTAGVTGCTNPMWRP